MLRLKLVDAGSASSKKEALLGNLFLQKFNASWKWLHSSAKKLPFMLSSQLNITFRCRPWSNTKRHSANLKIFHWWKYEWTNSSARSTIQMPLGNNVSAFAISHYRRSICSRNAGLWVPGTLQQLKPLEFPYRLLTYASNSAQHPRRRK